MSEGWARLLPGGRSDGGSWDPAHLLSSGQSALGANPPWGPQQANSQGGGLACGYHPGACGDALARHLSSSTRAGMAAALDGALSHSLLPWPAELAGSGRPPPTASAVRGKEEGGAESQGSAWAPQVVGCSARDPESLLHQLLAAESRCSPPPPRGSAATGPHASSSAAHPAGPLPLLGLRGCTTGRLLSAPQAQRGVLGALGFSKVPTQTRRAYADGPSRGAGIGREEPRLALPEETHLALSEETMPQALGSWMTGGDQPLLSAQDMLLALQSAQSVSIGQGSSIGQAADAAGARGVQLLGSIGLPMAPQLLPQGNAGGTPSGRGGSGDTRASGGGQSPDTTAAGPGRGSTLSRGVTLSGGVAQVPQASAGLQGAAADSPWCIADGGKPSSQHSSPKASTQRSSQEGNASRQSRHQAEEDKRLRKLALNREAARRMRRRQALRLEELEKTVLDLQAANVRTRGRLRDAEKRIEELEGKKAQLEKHALAVATDMFSHDASARLRDKLAMLVAALSPRSQSQLPQGLKLLAEYPQHSGECVLQLREEAATPGSKRKADQVGMCDSSPSSGVAKTRAGGQGLDGQEAQLAPAGDLMPKDCLGGEALMDQSPYLMPEGGPDAGCGDLAFGYLA